MNTKRNKHDPSRLWLSVDVGGTTMKLALLRGEDIPSLQLLQRRTIPTRTEAGGRFILPDLADAAEGLVTEAGFSLADIAGLGMGVPGPVLPQTAQGFPVNGCVNLNWTGLSYPDATLRDLTGIRSIFLCNDANAAALGELYFGDVPEAEAPDDAPAASSPGTDTPASGGDAPASGSDAPVQDAVMVTIGTGIGGGIVLSGALLTGAFGAGGEVGHMPMHPSGALLHRIRQADPTLLLPHADLEYYTSAVGIARVARAALQADLDGTPSILRQAETPQARDVFDAAKAKDPLALDVTDFFFDTLGQGLACIASTADPALFIIGGGVAAAGDFLLEGLQTAYRRHVFHAHRQAAFRLARLGNDAGLLGPLVPLLLTPSPPR